MTKKMAQVSYTARLDIKKTIAIPQGFIISLAPPQAPPSKNFHIEQMVDDILRANKNADSKARVNLFKEFIQKNPTVLVEIESNIDKPKFAAIMPLFSAEELKSYTTTPKDFEIILNASKLISDLAPKYMEIFKFDGLKSLVLNVDDIFNSIQQIAQEPILKQLINLALLV